MITNLDPDESRELLRNCQIARLGCVDGNEPYVVPVHYILEDDCAVIHSLPGRKIQALRANSRACLQVDNIQDSVHWSSVLAYGNYEEIWNADERGRVLELFLRRFHLLTPVEAAILGDSFSPEVIVFRIRIDEISGMREG
jgi:nitroimidazol reductase NimA-like FMN-containing flavoprotein (pyridoxamine 5'-phosphate oxidase superfamily)